MKPTNPTDIFKEEQEAEDEEQDFEDFWLELFYDNDLGAEYGDDHYVYYNGKPCVYWSDGLWISKEGIEYDDRSEFMKRPRENYKKRMRKLKEHYDLKLSEFNAMEKNK